MVIDRKDNLYSNTCAYINSLYGLPPIQDIVKLYVKFTPSGEIIDFDCRFHSSIVILIFIYVF